jgi:indole-3-glycerol phosphate synthase
MNDVLAQIVEHKKREVALAQAARPVAQLEALLPTAPPVRDFAAALREGAGIRAIAEIKKASPSAGLIRADFDPVSLARVYERHGAACISVLTDEKYFQGRLEYLSAVRRAVSLPVLRKDFLIDRYQVLEARAAGADCVLLIAECLDDCTMRDLYFYASSLGMESLIELYDPENLERVLALEPALVGINNRNLRTMTTDLAHTLALKPRVPAGCLLVSESGIRTRQDVERLEHAGVKAILVGESLMRAADVGLQLDLLLGHSPGSKP